MTLTDSIQVAILAIMAATFVAMVVQMRTQNRMVSAQLLRDRFETYWEAITTDVSDDDIRAFHDLPDNYIDLGKYSESYEGNEEKLRKYIRLLNLYEYLAFSFSMRKLRLPDPLGHFWTEEWTKDLLAHIEFLDVHEYHKRFYPDFANYIDNVLRLRHMEETSVVSAPS